MPASVKSLGGKAFEGCVRLTAVRFQGEAPSADASVYDGTPESLISYVVPGTKGWPAKMSDPWKERPFIYQAVAP
jgi:hypothetical protein